MTIWPPPLPPPPPSTKAVVLTLTVSGDVSDYADTSDLQRIIAEAAGVDVWFVSIRVAAASVLISAIITVPASTTASVVQAALSSSLGTAVAASAALGIAVESTPTIKVVDEASEGSDGSSAVTIAAAAGGGAAALVLALLLLVAYRTCKQAKLSKVRRGPHCSDLALQRATHPPNHTHIHTPFLVTSRRSGLHNSRPRPRVDMVQP